MKLFKDLDPFDNDSISYLVIGWMSNNLRH